MGISQFLQVILTCFFMAIPHKQLIFVFFDLARIARTEVGGQGQAWGQLQISTLDNFIERSHKDEEIPFLIKVTHVQSFVPAVQT